MKVIKKTPSMTIEKIMAGDEPIWNQKGQMSFIRALNWYSSVKDCKDSKQYFLEYLKKNSFDKASISKISTIPEYHFSNVGFVCRMKMRGAVLTESQEINILQKLESLLSFTPDSKFDIGIKKEVNIQEKIFDQATQYINDIEGFVDEFIKTKKANFNCYDWLNSNSIKPIYIAHIKNHYMPLENEISSALLKKDDQLQESYSHWSKKELTSYLNFISGILKDCNDYLSNSKTVKKTRKKKTISLDKKVSKLQYKKEDSYFKIVSINPTEILSASQLWVFNAKTKKLGLYRAKDESGFSIKGTTLEGFDEKSSFQKTLRKPEEQLKFVLDKKISNKKFFSDFWNSVKTTETPLTGRINGEVVLLKVIK